MAAILHLLGRRLRVPHERLRDAKNFGGEAVVEATSRHHRSRVVDVVGNVTIVQSTHACGSRRTLLAQSVRATCSRPKTRS